MKTIGPTGTLAVTVCVLLSLLSAGCSDEQNEQAAQHSYELSVNGSVKLPGYKVLDRKVYDVPIKTQVQLDLLVSGNLTPAGLRNLLAKLFLETDKQGGFRCHFKPTHVFIYAYSDEERAESGSGGWVAMLSKVGEGAKPKITVNEKLLAVLKEKPVERLGLSEARRKAVWTELVRAEDRAWGEAEKKHPLEPGQALKVGDEFRLTKETGLMPALNPVDPIGAIAMIRGLPPGTVIRVQKIVQKGGAPWYQVSPTNSDGASVGSGWVNSIALIGQANGDGRERVQKQLDCERELNEKYNAKIAKKHGLNAEELMAISVEGVKKHWPMPKRQPMARPTPEQPNTRATEKQANVKLALARNYLQLGRKDQARKILESIIKDYSHTPSAKEAKEELEHLK